MPTLIQQSSAAKRSEKAPNMGTTHSGPSVAPSQKATAVDAAKVRTRTHRASGVISLTIEQPLPGIRSAPG